MKNSILPLGAGLAMVLAAAVFACSDTPVKPVDDGDTEPDPDPPTASVFLSGPSSVYVDCRLKAFANFRADVHAPDTDTKSVWKVDGVVAEEGDNLNMDFAPVPEEYSIVVDVLYLEDGTLLDSDTLDVSVLPLEDPASCATEAHIEGRWGVLIPPEAASTEAVYRAEIPVVLQDQVTGFVWHLQAENEPSQEVLSGPSADSLLVDFSNPGEYTIAVDQILDGDTVSSSLDVRVLSGEPLAEPGKILMVDGSGDTRQVRFMDGETGLLSEPIPEPAGSFSGAVCSDDRVVYLGSSSHGSGYDVYEMGLDGSGTRLLSNLRGSETGIDLWGDFVLFTANFRTGPGYGEVVMYDLSTGELQYLAGETPDTTFIGSQPTFLGSPDKFILSGRLPDKSNKLVVYTKSGEGWTKERLGIFSYGGRYGASAVGEGSINIAWDPRNELVAYTVNASSQDLAIAALDGSFARVLAENANGRVTFTPSGSHIIFQKANWDVPSPDGQSASGEILMIPREGGEIISLSRALAQQDEYISHLSYGYCSARK